jgi:SAM-dependent methyltransferase
MSFSKEWESVYAQKGHLNRWPWSDVVSLVMRQIRPSGPSFRVLELGAGPGTNAGLFLALGVEYWAIEGSASAVEVCAERFPELQQRVRVADFSKAWPVEGQFDLIFDRAALTHNSEAALRAIVGQISERLKPGGRFLGVDWFSTKHSDFAIGEAGEDNWTKKGFTAGTFAGVGAVHFSDRAHLESLFQAFRFEYLQHTERQTQIPAGGADCSWNLIVRKPT